MSTCQSVTQQDTEPKIALDSQANTMNAAITDLNRHDPPDRSGRVFLHLICQEW